MRINYSCRHWHLILLLAEILLTSPAWADIHALVIGINKYATVGELDGAVNDAKEIVVALHSIGVTDITALFDGEATKNAVVTGWDGILKRATPGDTIIFTYAGHGGEEPEHVKGSEKTGKDQNLLFSRFNPSTEDNAERLIDDEIALMVKRAVDAKIAVVMVMDACHSGTMTRGIDTRVRKFKFRAAKYPPIQNDRLGPIDPAGAYLKLEDQKDLLYFGAVQDHELAPEITVDDQQHGALSVSIARGLKGGADINHNGIVTSVELGDYVRETVRILVEGQQNPSLMRGSDISLVIQPAESTPAKPTTLSFATEVSAIAIQIMNPDPAHPAADLLAKLTGVVAAENPSAAILTWDVRRGHLLNQLGDIVAYANEQAVAIPAPITTRGFGRSVPPPVAAASLAVAEPSSTCDDVEKRGFGRSTRSAVTCDGVVDIGKVQKVIDKWRIVEEVRQHALQDAFAITLSPSDGLHHQNDNVTLNVSGQRYTYFTLFNISSDGTVNFLYPLTGDPYRDPLEIPLGRNYKLDLTVQPPFGSDHFIAIASNQPLNDLHRDLAARDGKQVAAELPEVLARTTKDKILQVGIHGVYTAPKL